MHNSIPEYASTVLKRWSKEKKEREKEKKREKKKKREEEKEKLHESLQIKGKLIF
jgi:hypothetical protein